MKLPLLLTAAGLLAMASGFGAEPQLPRLFEAARPVWPAGRETEMNLFVEFRAAFERPASGAVKLRLTGASIYRVLVNGEFAGYGPARGGHGVHRVDEWPLDARLRRGRNEVTIEVAGYNTNSFYLLDQPAFLQAEIVAGTQVLAATGGPGFTASLRGDRVQKVQRYSFQRPFSEVWQVPAQRETVACAEVAAKSVVPRGVPYPDFALRRPVAHVAAGTMLAGPLPERPWKDRSLTAISPKLKGFPEKELATIPSLELQRWRTSAWRAAGTRVTLGARGFHTLDFGVNLSGFLGATVEVRTRTRLFLAFDEILTDGDVDWKRLDCVNLVAYDLPPGRHRLESFEPYTLRYLKVIALEGECEVKDIYLREYANPEAGRARFAASDERLNRIFEAARETFRQNAVDVFTDCPSRERAGWLCDSFFTGRAALDFCGTTSVERAFLENFQHPAAFPFLPEGMLAMCYPADHYNGQFIPNWAMWYVLELEEYARRSGDRALVDAARPQVLRLAEFFRKLENGDGLLEKLPSWVFVEWSDANRFVQDVNYPSNMLYAAMLDATARLYSRPELAQQAAKLRDTIRAQSYDGRFFVDNAVRREGKLVRTDNRSEVCQYFAFYFGLASPETHAELWQTLRTGFGPGRTNVKTRFGVSPANAFIGHQLRFELLARAGLAQQILDEAIGGWLYMADRTGTLWEHDAPQASCNHGFASHAGHVLLRDVLGLQDVDTVKRTLHVRFTAVGLESCEGAIPTPDGEIALRWTRTGDRLTYRLSVPRGYQVSVDNRSGLQLAEQRP